MAKNTGENFRKGSVTDRSQTKTPSGNYVKRSSENGEFTDQKADKQPFKGVAKEPDGRKAKSKD